MALSFKIGPSVYEALSADVKKEYKKVGDDYQLDIEGYEDPVALRNARDHEKEAARIAKAEAADAKRRADKAEKDVKDLTDAGKSVDEAVKAKETEMQAKYDKDTKDLTDKLGALTTATITNHKRAAAEALANKISVSPELLAPRLMDRMDVEIDPATNTPKLHILGTDGQRSAHTLADLEKETLANKAYAPILRGTKATGGGGAPTGPGGGGAPRQQPHHRPGTPADDLTKIPAADFAARIAEEKAARGQ
jgi:hypothetical protein